MTAWHAGPPRGKRAAARSAGRERPRQAEQGRRDDPALWPASREDCRGHAGPQRDARLEDGPLPRAAPGQDRAIGRYDRAEPGRGSHGYRAAGRDRVDAGHRQLLEALAELAVELEVRVIGLDS